jgi:hypothetical protein
VAVCPENAINLQGWTLKQYEAMVDMIVSDAYLEQGVIKNYQPWVAQPAPPGSQRVGLTLYEVF